jgi:hypothetical protein
MVHSIRFPSLTNSLFFIRKSMKYSGNNSRVGHHTPGQVDTAQGACWDLISQTSVTIQNQAAHTTSGAIEIQLERKSPDTGNKIPLG